MKTPFFACVLLLLAGCAPARTASPTPVVISIQASPAARPWLSEAYACAQAGGVILAETKDPALADVSLRIGEPDELKTPAFQIGSDDLLVITPRESPLQNLTPAQAQALFSDPGADVQVWVFAGGEDIQKVFARQVLQGAALSSRAHLALSPQQMSDLVNQGQGAMAGFLPRRWKAGTVRDIFTLPDVPVLAITRSEPQGALHELLACLQSKRPAR